MKRKLGRINPNLAGDRGERGDDALSWRDLDAIQEICMWLRLTLIDEFTEASVAQRGERKQVERCERSKVWKAEKTVE